MQIFLFTFTIKTNEAMSIESVHNDGSARITITKTVLDNLVSQNYKEVPKDFDSELSQKLTTEKICEMWQKITSVLGPFKETLSAKTDVQKGQNQVKLRCKFARKDATLETIFTQDDKVAHFFIYP
jgi:hypothetical protein